MVSKLVTKRSFMSVVFLLLSWALGTLQGAKTLLREPVCQGKRSNDHRVRTLRRNKPWEGLDRDRECGEHVTRNPGWP